MTNQITRPDGSITTPSWDQKIDERTKVLTETLFNIQKRMPPGQMFSLYSYGACKQLAEELNDKLSEWELNKGKQQTPYN